FDRFFLNSIVTTGVGTALEISLAILCAYAFVFVDFKYKKYAFVLIIASLMLPGHVTLIVNYITVANLGWLNSYAGLILPGIASAFAMFLLYQYMRTIDKDILQAAEIDGAGHLRRMLTIVVPLASPMILTATIIVMVGKWNEYVWPLIVTSTADMRTLPIGLLFLRSQEGYSNWGVSLAGAVFVSLPVLFIFFLAQRRIIGGLAAGALKCPSPSTTARPHPRSTPCLAAAFSSPAVASWPRWASAPPVPASPPAAPRRAATTATAASATASPRPISPFPRSTRAAPRSCSGLLSPV